MAGIAPPSALQAAATAAAPPAAPQMPDMSNLSYGALTGPAVLDHAAANPSAPPAAHSMADFITKLHQAGFGALDPNIQISLASAGAMNPMIKGVLGTVQNGLAQAADNAGQVGHFFSDPGLVTTPTTAQKVAWHFYNNGIPLVSQSDIAKTQQFLIDKGYGQSLAGPGYAKPVANGVWDGNWNQSLYNYQNTQRNQPALGTMSARQAFMTLFTPFMWAKALPLIMDTVKSLPKDLLFAIKSQADPNSVTTPGESVGQAAGSAVGALGTLFMASSLTKDLVKSAFVMKAASDAGIKAGASNAATGLFKVLPKEAVAKPTTIMNSILPEMENGVRRFPMTRAFQNSPTLGFMNNVNKVSTGLYEGWQGQRAIAASAFRLPILGAARDIGNVAAISGGKIGLVGNTEKALGDNQGPQAQILDHLTPIAGRVGNVVNLAQALVGTSYDGLGRPSQTIGHAVKDLTDSAATYLGQSGILANWARGTGADYTKAVGKVVKAGGSQQDVDASLINNVNNLSAWHAAQGKLEAHPDLATMTDSDKFNFMRSVSHAIKQDPTGKLAAGRESYLLKPGVLAKDLNKEMYNMKSDATYVYSKDFTSKIMRDKTMRESIIPDAQYLITPHTMAQQADAALWNPADTPVVPKSPGTIEAQQVFAKADAANNEAQQAVNDAQGRVQSLSKTLGQQTSEKNAAVQRVNTLTAKIDQTLTNTKSADPAIAAAASKILTAAKKELAQANANVDRLTKEASDRAQIGEGVARATAKARAVADAKAAMENWRQTQVKRGDAGKALSHAQARDGVPNATAEGEVNPPLRANQAATLNQDTPLGSLGHMNIERQTSGDAQAMAHTFYGRLEKAKPGYKAPDFIAPAEVGDDGLKQIVLPKDADLPKNFDVANASVAELNLRKQVFSYLASELDVNIQGLRFVPTDKLINLIVNKSHMLPSDVHLPFDAPQSLRDGVEHLNAQGGKLVFGTDIGHQFTNSPMPLEKLGIAQGKLAQYADKLGVGFERVSPEVASQHAYISAQNTMQDALLDADKFPYGTVPVWGTASNLLNFAQSVIKPDMNWLSSLEYNFYASKFSRALHPIRGGAWDKQIAEIMATNSKLTRAEAKASLQKSLITNTGPQYWTRKQFIDAMTNKGDEQGNILNNYGHEAEAVGMPVEQAGNLYYALQKGLRDTPAFVNGMTPFNKMLDSTFGLGNIPLAIKGRRVLDLTSDIRQQLSSYRYQASYRFAYLRVIKAGFKGVTKNVPFTLDAEAGLKALGPTVEKQAYALRDRLLGPNPEQKSVTDFITQEYGARDIANVYNPRAIEARDLHYLYQDALAKTGGDASKVDEGAVLKDFHDIYDYGPRTAFEKSINAFFFPFSFEKTVMRQLGGHLLDDPGARLATAVAINAYDSSQGQAVKTWMESNLPLFKELEKFNPFYHGIGLGQFGGIQRMPYEVAKKLFIQMTSPQPITSKASANAVVALIPAYRDLANIVLGIDPNGKKPTQWGGELASTMKAGAWELGNLAGKLTGHTNENPLQVQDHLPYGLQQTNGWNLRSVWMTSYAKLLDENRKGANNIWKTDVPVVGGKKITSTSINDLVNHIYPKWDSAAMQIAAAERQKASAIERGVIMAKSPQWRDTYDQWIKASDRIGGLLAKDSIDTAHLAQATATMRKYAIALATNDRSFYEFYKRYYQSKFGPLEAIQ